MSWIKCSDRLPFDCESVLIYSRGYTVISAYLVYDLKKEPIYWNVNDWDESDTTWEIDEVTHWMPLPEPPKE